ncbi:MAG: DUF1501 domain-containing protein [Methylococcales bacterium]
MSNHINQQRRKFIKMAMVGGASTMLATQNKLNLMSSAMASEYSTMNDYKSLVCIYLRGGNDAFNMLVPRVSSEYTNYQKTRQKMAIPKSNLLPIANGQYGFHPSMPLIRNLYNQQQLAVVANTGVLFRPTTLNSFRNNHLIPPDLFSHSHQMDIWQTGYAPNPGIIRPGWGGLIADKLNSANQTNAGIPPTFTLSGTNLWQTGEITRQLGVGSSGIKKFRFFSEKKWELSRRRAFEEIMQMNSSHPLQSQMQHIINDTRGRVGEVKLALDQSPELTSEFDSNNRLAKQLRMVAKLISVREQLGMKRQLFFVSAGSWDTHSNQVKDHADLLAMLDGGIGSFQNSLQELDAMGIASTNSVTTFTASEFGRTLTSNGDGTDHGWASHYLVSGGAVQGGLIHGNIPAMEIGGENDATGEYGTPAGRFIPEYSVDQYGATLARWLGVSEADIPTIFPNLKNFSQKDLGFMG